MSGNKKKKETLLDAFKGQYKAALDGVHIDIDMKPRHTITIILVALAIIIATVLLLIINVIKTEIKEVKADKNEVQAYEEYLIGNLTEDEYLTDISDAIKIVYEMQKSDISNVKDYLNKYMTEDLTEEFISESENIKGSIKCTVDYIYLCYGKHEQDGITKIISHATITSDKRYWKIHFEMKLNNEDKIYDIEVY